MSDLELELQELRSEVKQLEAFKSFFDDLYGIGLTVTDYHINGYPEQFDNLYEEAVSWMEEEMICHGGC